MSAPTTHSSRADFEQALAQHPVLPSSKRWTAESLASEFRRVRDLTEDLAAPLSPEDQTVQTMPDVSPTKWHRAHVTWFFETFVLAEFQPRFATFQDTYWTLFNSYYETVGPRYPRANRGFISRPGAHEVGEYRRHVDDRMTDLLAGADEQLMSRLASVLELGFHHENQHQELLLMDIKHVLAQNPLQPVAYPGSRTTAGSVRSAQWLEFTGGVVEIGSGSAAFTFDNELPAHPVLLQPFRLSNRLVTNGEWLDFMADGGYERHELWLSDGWARVSAEQWDSPLYWRHEDGQWMEHTLHGTRPIRLNEPVLHVSHYEADAFATWAGKRLPTEFEWEHAVRHSGVRAPDVDRDITGFHPQPDSEGEESDLRQVFDAAWQWTSSAYLPYPGFRAPDGAIGEYNGKFMSGQMVLRGGASITPRGHARSTYRNFFPAHSRWAFTGVRLAEDAH